MAQPGSVVTHIKVDDILLGGQSSSVNRIYHVPDERFNAVGPAEQWQHCYGYAIEERIRCFDLDNRIVLHSRDGYLAG